jgi:hypothetical protein
MMCARVLREQARNGPGTRILRLTVCAALLGPVPFVAAPPIAAQPIASQPIASSDAEAELGEIRRLVLHANYDEAVRASEALLARTDLDASQRNRALELVATARVANREEAAAREVAATLYARDPAHRLAEDASPPIQSFFARARDARPDLVPVELEVRPPEPTTSEGRREPPLVVARVAEGADAVQEVRLAYRQGGDSTFVRVVMSASRDGTARARIPELVGEEGAYVVEYFVEALAPSLHVLDREGDESAPLRFEVAARTRTQASLAPLPLQTATAATPPPVPAESGGSILATWWFWSLVALAVGGGVAAFVLLGPPSDGPEEGSLGSIRLR